MYNKTQRQLCPVLTENYRPGRHIYKIAYFRSKSGSKIAAQNTRNWWNRAASPSKPIRARIRQWTPTMKALMGKCSVYSLLHCLGVFLIKTETRFMLAQFYANTILRRACPMLFLVLVPCTIIISMFCNIFVCLLLLLLFFRSALPIYAHTHSDTHRAGAAAKWGWDLIL